MKKAINRIRSFLKSITIPSSFPLRTTIIISCAALVIGLMCGFIVSRVVTSGQTAHNDEHADGDKHGDEKGHGDAHDEHGEEGDADDEPRASITVSPSAISLLSFSYTPVRRGIFERTTTVSGRILSEPQATATVTAPRAGIIKQCFTEAGTSVRAGDVLCILTPSDGAAAMEITSPISGVILSSYARDNNPVDRLTVIHIIADLSEFAAVFDVYERDITAIGQRRPIEVRANAFAGRVFNGRITFVSPRVDEESRTIKVRALVKNQDMLLRLGMFVSGTIKSPAGLKLLVPEEAVQDAGSEKIVFVKSESNTFKPIEVVVQETSAGIAAVSGELTPGQMVVTRGAPYLRGAFLKGEVVDACPH